MTDGMLHGLVLAGGHGRRFGQDKGSYLWQGQSLRDRALTLVRRHASPVWLLLRPDQAKPSQSGVLLDRSPGAGPLIALADAMSASPGVSWLVLACDLPLLTPESLADLVARPRDGYDAVLFQHPDKKVAEPLAGIWCPSGVAALLRARQAGEKALMPVLRDLRIAGVVPRDARELQNTNHRSELPSDPDSEFN